MLFLVLACYFLFPLFVYFVYEKIAHRKFWSKGTALTKILCSYSFYFIGLSLSGVSASIEFYMSSNCAWSGEGLAPCNELMYWIADFVVTWLVLIMVALGIYCRSLICILLGGIFVLVNQLIKLILRLVTNDNKTTDLQNLSP